MLGGKIIRMLQRNIEQVRGIERVTGILNWMIRESLTEKVTFEQESEILSNTDRKCERRMF